MDRFLERHKLLKVTHGEIRNLNRSITGKQIELIIIKNTYPQWKFQTHMSSLVNSTKYLMN